MTEHPGDHTPDPVRHSSEEFHAVELQERWLDENPGRTADDYSAWKMANSSSSSNNPTSVFDAWARGVGRDVAAQEEQSAEDLRLAQVIADAEAHAAGWAHAKALFSDAPHTQVWTSLAEPNLTSLQTTLGVAPSDAVPGLADAQTEARRWARASRARPPVRDPVLQIRPHSRIRCPGGAIGLKHGLRRPEDRDG